MSKFFITTAIDYVNSLPHIGTAYEKIGTDVLARFHRFIGDDVLFQMGNDEHSVNVKKSAEDEGLEPKAYCDKMRPGFELAWEKLEISYDQFIQTSDPRHHEAVRKLFQKIYDNGHIYEGEYEGLYCESCEAFYTDKDLEDGLCPQHKKEPKQIKETEEKIKRIEAEVKDIRSSHLVANNLVSDKLNQLSRTGLDLEKQVQLVHEVLDQFQKAHVIIKRPGEAGIME